MEVSRTSKFIQQRVVAGVPGVIVEERRQEINDALVNQERRVLGGLEGQQERFAHQVDFIAEQMAALDPLDPRKEKLLAMQAQINRLKEIQGRLLEGVAEKREELKEQREAVGRAKNVLAQQQNQLQVDQFAQENKFFLQLGKAACQHATQL